MAPILPQYWIPRPTVTISDEADAAYKELWNAAIRSEDVVPPVKLPDTIEKWRYLDWLVQSKQVLLHGSAQEDISLFFPRPPNDHSADDFSKQTAVYATTDAIWSIYYAVLDRSYGLRHLNAYLQFAQEEGWSKLHYFFSLDRQSLASSPWRTGFVYVLPSMGFVQQPPYHVQTWTVLDPHFANSNAVQPIAKIQVHPSDFPLREYVRAHIDSAVIEAQAIDPFGFPWIDRAIGSEL